MKIRTVYFVPSVSVDCVFAALFVLLMFTSIEITSAQFRPRTGRTTNSAGASRGQVQQNDRSLELRVLSDDRGMVGAQQRWMEMLSNVGADRVVSETSRESQPSVEENDLGSSGQLVSVIGIIKDNRLLLPGGRFSISDRARIRDHLQKLRDDGAEITLAEKMAFGLTSKQLVSLHDQLSAPVTMSTKGRLATEVAKELVNLAGISTQIDEDAKPLIESKELMADELQGLSVGTALAAAVRPLGLVVEPKREQGGQIKLRLRDSRAAEENWPVGWPISEPPVKATPKLFTQLDLQIRLHPMNEVLDAFEDRLQIPFLYDHNGMARAGIDPAQIKVTYVKNKTNYGIAMTKILIQSKPKMKYEVRIDEVGKPFFWIAPM